MSQPQASDSIANYHSAIKSFEYIASLFNNGPVNVLQIHQELQNCYERIDHIISKEDTSCPYLIELHYLKRLVLEQIKIVERKSIQQVSSIEISSKMQHDSDDRAQNFIKSTIESPIVNSLKEIAGLWEIKKILKSLVILPQTQPQLFDNCRICNSVLLFGPPGTGKTRIVHAVASEANATLHRFSVGNMLSAFVGETEKNMLALFEFIKRANHFSILFIDEVDGFCRTRHNSEQDHTRRMKTELMCQMSKIEDHRNIFLICATNCPWDLDIAFLRRFQKRIYIPLPNKMERRELLQLFSKDMPLEEHSEYLDHLVEKTEGLSGSDISDLVQSALNIPIMELQDTKIWKSTSDGFYEPIVTPEDFSLDDTVYSELEDLPHHSVRARSPQILDILNSLESVVATVSITNVKKYEAFLR